MVLFGFCFSINQNKCYKKFAQISTYTICLSLQRQVNLDVIGKVSGKGEGRESMGHAGARQAKDQEAWDKVGKWRAG